MVTTCLSLWERQLLWSHVHELDASGIDRELAHLNFWSLVDSEPYDYLFYADQLERRNDGRLTDYWLRLYTHLDGGGWWCSGLDPLTDWSPMTWGCFKPNFPRSDSTDPAHTKLIKYEHPPRTATRLFCLRVPLHLWQAIAQRYGLWLPSVVDLTDYSHFWRWVCQYRLPVILCEGAKKAASLLSHGYVAIALPGIFGGVRTVRDLEGRVVARHLIPELQWLSQTGVTFVLCFDYEIKPKTLANVRLSLRLQSRLLLEAGASVRLLTLPGPEKGVDDYLLRQSVDAFVRCYQHSVALEMHQSTNGLRCVQARPNLLPAWAG